MIQVAGSGTSGGAVPGCGSTVGGAPPPSLGPLSSNDIRLPAVAKLSAIRLDERGSTSPAPNAPMLATSVAGPASTAAVAPVGDKQAAASAAAP